ncbi:MAG TPA: alpha/beta hydrolase [Deltaproteobacteria bacterium]|nr:alpha/beta hydrolase [Deltaproteobacteria bacterium]
MTVYLIHGLLESSLGQFAPQIRRWQGRGTIVPLQLPGHAENTLDAGSDLIGDSVRLLAAAVERYGPGHVIAASYLGSPVALRYALEPDTQASSLVLMGLVPEVPEEIFSRWVQGFYVLADENPSLADAYERTHGPRWRSTLDAFAGVVERAYEEEIAVSWPMLEGSRIPVLVANGSHKSNERGAARRADEAGGMLSGHVFEGAGHVPSRDRPEAFAVTVESFWRSGNPRGLEHDA